MWVVAQSLIPPPSQVVINGKCHTYVVKGTEDSGRYLPAYQKGEGKGESLGRRNRRPEYF
jgi:hypothetical protein